MCIRDSPHIGGSAVQGLRYNQDFFWAISQSYDATFSLDFRGKKGVGSGIEYRYLPSTDTRGTVQAERFHDIEKDSNRVAIRYRHQQRLSDRMNINLSARYVNTKDYFTELSDFTSERALQKIESNAALTYRGDESFGYLLARYTQDLTRTDNRATLQRLPEAGWNLIGHKIGPVFLDLHAVYTRFYRQTDFVWDRINLSPMLSLPLVWSSAMTVTPWAKYYQINYSRTVLADRSLRMDITGSGIDLDAKWSGTIGKNPIRFSKKLTYEAIKAEEISGIPQADDFDKIHNRRSLTLSVSPSVLSSSIRFTQTYNIDRDISSSARFSDLRTDMKIAPFPSLSIEAESFYHWQNQNVTAVNTNLRFHDQDKRMVSIGQRYTRGGLLPQKGDLFNPFYLGDSQPAPDVSFVTGRFMTKLSDKMTFAAEAFYSASADRFVEIHYGLLYERQCWLIALAYQDLFNKNEVLFTVSLKGLGENIPRPFAYLFQNPR